jgi:hypothetical protein
MIRGRSRRLIPVATLLWCLAQGQRTDSSLRFRCERAEAGHCAIIVALFSVPSVYFGIIAEANVCTVRRFRHERKLIKFGGVVKQSLDGRACRMARVNLCTV